LLLAQVVPQIPRIFDSVFQCTLEMITQNFLNFPDTRVAFYTFLKEINAHAFPALLALNAEQFRLVMDSIVWGIKHIERTIAELGLTILLDLLKTIELGDVANDFHKRYFAFLVKDMFGVLTDTFHRPGFTLHATILAKLFATVETGQITLPLWDGDPRQYPNNQQFVREFTASFLHNMYPNLSMSQIDQFVLGLFQLNNNIPAFKNHLRDFLVNLKEFAGKDNSDLFLEEKRAQEAERKAQEAERVAAVPGLQYTAPTNQTNSLQSKDQFNF
jgi:exportin-1